MEEKTRILNMVAEGKVTPEQAAQLLEALEADAASQSPAFPVGDYDRKLFRIQVNSGGGDKINLQFPVEGVKKIIKATGKLPIKMDGMEGADMDELMDAVAQCLDDQVTGDIITMESADGDHIRLWVE